MLTPYSPHGGGSEKYYLRYLLIGLKTGRKIVWLEKPDKPNIRLTDKQILIETVSGEKKWKCVTAEVPINMGILIRKVQKTLSKIKNIPMATGS